MHKTLCVVNVEDFACLCRPADAGCTYVQCAPHWSQYSVELFLTEGARSKIKVRKSDISFISGRKKYYREILLCISPESNERKKYLALERVTNGNLKDDMPRYGTGMRACSLKNSREASPSLRALCSLVDHFRRFTYFCDEICQKKSIYNFTLTLVYFMCFYIWKNSYITHDMCIRHIIYRPK